MTFRIRLTIPAAGLVIPGAALAVLAALLLVIGLRAGPLTFDRVAATVTAPDDTSHRLCLLHAVTAEQHQRGLMGATSLEGCDGMVFSFATDTDRPFWMRGTPLPLSVAFFDSQGRLVSAADMAPCGDRADCPRYPPAMPYRYALEVSQGRLAGFGVVPGARLVLTGRAC